MSGVGSQIVERIPSQTLPSGFGDDSGGGSTDKLLKYVVARFGPVASFSGSYRADRWELFIQRTPIESGTCKCNYIHSLFIREGLLCCPNRLCSPPICPSESVIKFAQCHAPSCMLQKDESIHSV